MCVPDKPRVSVQMLNETISPKKNPSTKTGSIKSMFKLIKYTLV